MNPLTVSEALGVPCLREAVLVAGAAGLSKGVEAVGVVDITDLEAVRPRQLLLTSAYPLRERDLVQLVRKVAAQGASALGIKLSGFWQQIPSELVRVAEEQEMPLLILPEGPFDEIVNPLLAAIADRQTESLRRSAEIHNRLTEAALREEGNSVVVTEILTRALGCPAAVLGERGELIAWTGEAALWPRTDLARRLEGATGLTAFTLEGDRYVLAPVPGVTRSSSAVCLHGADGSDAFVRASLAHGAVVVGMLLAGRRQVEAIYLRFERELLEDLVDRRLVDRAEAVGRTARTGWPLDRPYVIIMASSRPTRLATLDGLSPLGLEGGDLPRLTRALGEVVEARLFLRRPGLGIVVHLTAQGEERAAVERVVGVLRQEDMPPALAAAAVGVSQPRMDVLALPDAYREAALAILLAPFREQDDRLVTRFRDLGPIRLLASVKDRARLDARARAIMGSLADFGGRRNRDLFLTLCELLSHNMNVSATSAGLFFHYNTVRHRLGHLHEATEGRLRSPAGRLSVSIAASAIRLLEAEQALTLAGRAGPA